MLPPVLVDVVPIEGLTDCVQVLLSACSTALESRPCERARRHEQVQAHVRWHSEFEVRISIDSAGGAKEQTLQFSSPDEPCERWRTAGLVLASLYGSTPAGETLDQNTGLNAARDATVLDRAKQLTVAPSRQLEQAPSVSDTTQASTGIPSDAMRHHASAPAWVFGACGLMAEGVGSGGLRYGVGAEGLWMPLRIGIGAVLTARGAWQAADADSVGFGWYSIGVGALGAYPFSARWSLEPSAHVGREWFVVQAGSVSGHPAETEVRGYLIVGARVALTWRFAGTLEAFSAAELWHTPAQGVWVAEERWGSNPQWLPVVGAGIRLRLR